MLYQITNHLDKSTKAFADPVALRTEVMKITNNPEEAQSVMEWATTPVFGGFRYDHVDFDIVIIGQSDVFYQG